MKDRFVESREGKTYIRRDDHDSLCKRFISQIRGPCGDISKWINKVEHMVIKIMVDDEELEYVNLDDVLYELMNEFKN